MEDAILDQLILNSEKQQQWVRRFSTKRYLYEALKKIDRDYYRGIKGIRGVGKTVLMLQLARETKGSLYISADSTILKPFTLYEIVKELNKRGYYNIFIDEIHRKTFWDVDLKTLYDEHEGRITFSGSSALDITKTSADLSRRVVLKELKPASFREFLNIRKHKNIPPIPFEKIIQDKVNLTKKYTNAFEYFKEYLKYGGLLYPKNGFYEALENSIKKIILQDLSALRDINIKYETDVYKLLYFIARSPPYQTNYSSIARTLTISKTMAIRIVNDLAETGIIIPILPCKKKGVDVKKEPKIYLTLPLREFFSKYGFEIERGATREEFFVNHIRDVCYLKGDRGEKTPDFRVHNIKVEIGGESKKKYQNPDYIAVDSLSTVENKIPLYLFGFVY